MAINVNEYPRPVSLLTHTGFQIILALISLCLIIAYDASAFMFRPYDGMAFDGPDFYVVTTVDEGGPAEKAGIQPGDKLLAIDGTPVGQWLSRPVYSAGIKTGDTVTYQILRNGETQTLSATMGDFFGNPTFFAPILGLQFLSIIFWLTGLSLCLFTSHGDVRARLAALAWLVTGIAVASGGPGGVSLFWGSGTVMKTAWVLLGFLLVTEHLYFPAPTFSAIHRKHIVGAAATIAVILFVVTLVDDVILKTYFSVYTGLNNFVYAFFLIAIMACLGLLLRGYFQSQDLDTRRQTRIVLWGMGLGFLPFLTLTLLPILLDLPGLHGASTTPFLILIPLSYAYVIHQRKLLKVDFIINRLVAYFVLGLSVLITSYVVLMIFAAVMKLPTSVPAIGGIVAVAAAFISFSMRDKVNHWVSRTLYGAYYDHASIAGSISNQLAHAPDRNTLVTLLTQDLAMQMGIKQTALFLSDGEMLKQQRGEQPYSVSLDDGLCQTLLDAREPMRAQTLWQECLQTARDSWKQFEWGEIFVPIIYENSLHGILILGERVAGDIYSAQDMHIIATVAHQSALASANIQFIEALRGLSQRLVRAGEEERKQLARELHDGVLQNLFFIKHRLRQDAESVGYINDVIDTLRRIIKAQRPSALDRGLVPALQDLIEDLNRVFSKSGPNIVWRNEVSKIDASDEQATAIYRIAQESISNAIRHAQARNITITLQQEGTSISLVVEDDGLGMPSTYAQGEHHGLIGMRERAIMIGANLCVTSNHKNGTRVVMEYNW